MSTKAKKVKITTIDKENRRSTQDLLQEIAQKVSEGYNHFDIEASGQHDIGCALWSKDGNKLVFNITNPGQRVGAMAMNNTEIVVEGSAPADVGWLNSGAKIVIKGDAGDTCSHCAASGKIYIGGRVGTRSGALMKHDPKYAPPELWVLKNTGSFSFEFMSGGIAVICGYQCEDMPSILSSRSCKGMVGGVVYFRGNIAELPANVEIKELDKDDETFLNKNIETFLKEIGKKELAKELINLKEYKKIVPTKIAAKERMSISEFRANKWVKDGIFSDFINDDYSVSALASTDTARLYIPVFDNKKCTKCNLCMVHCPQKAIKKDGESLKVEDKSCIGCAFCSAICPCGCWSIRDNIRDVT